MNCLILAAGMGSRLRQKAECKPLIEIAGIPLIDHILINLSCQDIETVYVVTGYNAHLLNEHFQKRSGYYPFNISTIFNCDWEQPNGISVLKARDKLNGDFFLLMADHLFDAANILAVRQTERPNNHICLAIDTNLDNPGVDLEDVTRVQSHGGKIRQIGKGLETYNGFDTGLFLANPSLFEALDKSSQLGDASLSGGIRYLAERGRVQAVDVSGSYWQDVDDPAMLKRAREKLQEPA